MDEGGRLRGRVAPGAGPGSESLVAVSGRTFDGRQPEAPGSHYQCAACAPGLRLPRRPVVSLEYGLEDECGFK